MKKLNKNTVAVAFAGFCAGIFSTIVFFMICGYVQYKKYSEYEEVSPINYYESPVSYESKHETEFRVIQVMDTSALATEISNKNYNLYLGNTVLLLGEHFYTDKIVTVYDPQIIGTYSYYTAKDSLPMTVPVIKTTITNN